MKPEIPDTIESGPKDPRLHTGYEHDPETLARIAEIHRGMDKIDPKKAGKEESDETKGDEGK